MHIYTMPESLSMKVNGSDNRTSKGADLCSTLGGRTDNLDCGLEGAAKVLEVGRCEVREGAHPVAPERI